MTIHQQMTETQRLVCPLQKRKRDKRTLLGSKYVFSTEGVCEIAAEVEEKTTANKARRKCKSLLITVDITQTKVDSSESDVSKAKSNCIVVTSSKLL
jgi:hypothetical protein